MQSLSICSAALPRRLDVLAPQTPRIAHAGTKKQGLRFIWSVRTTVHAALSKAASHQQGHSLTMLMMRCAARHHAALSMRRPLACNNSAMATRYANHARRRRLEKMRAFSSARERARAAAAEELKQKNQRMLLYGSALAISTLALCYASVPLYKVFCQATGFGGTT